MGGIIKSVFGGSSQKSTQKSEQESGNKFSDFLMNAFGPSTGLTGAASGGLASLLGLTGGGDQAAAQANFRNTPGYEFARDEGLRGIGAGQASKGLFNSGSTGKAMSKYATGLADQTYNNYLDKLLGAGNLGLGAGQLVQQGGQYSRGTSTGTSSGDSSSGGLGKAIGFGLGLLSDERLKKDIVEIGEHEGLPVYEFRYKWEDEDTVVHVGVMAQDVAKAMPEALGLPLFDYMRVDYSKIPNWSK